MKSSVIIPAYNEENSVEMAIKKVKEIDPQYEIIVVNDGSSDTTEKLARQMGVQVITHKINLGYGAALKTGLKSAKTKYIAFLDADLTYNPKYIPLFLEIAKKEDLDCIMGNRFGGEANKMPLIRKIGNKLISIIFFLVTSKVVSDCTTGERLFKAEVLDRLDLDTLPDDLDFITALTKRTVNRGLKYKEVPIDYEEREGSSKLNIIRHGYKMIKNVILY